MVDVVCRHKRTSRSLPSAMTVYPRVVVVTRHMPPIIGGIATFSRELVTNLRLRGIQCWAFARQGASTVVCSSRRRHTIFDCDWSSDVCSSDLAGTAAPHHRQHLGESGRGAGADRHRVLLLRCADHAGDLGTGRRRGPGGAEPGLKEWRDWKSVV